MGWFGKPKEEELPTVSAAVDSFQEIIQLNPETTATLTSFADSWSTPQLCTLAGASIVGFLVGIKAGRTQMSLRRIKSLQDLHSNQFGPNAVALRGRVTAVSDGDTFRFYHVPTVFHSTRPTEKKQELPIRICTIDTPEVAKFGNEGQAFGEDAKEKLSSIILDKMVTVQLLQRDHYGRAVAQVERSGWFWSTYCDEEILKAGLAEVYTGGGAVYGHRGLDYYLGLQEKAQIKKSGIWKLGDKRESAAEYKARIKASK